MTKTIDLISRNGVIGKVLVDDEDHERVNRHRWHFHSAGYAYTGIWDGNVKRQRSMLMHRLVLGLEIGDKCRVVHLDGNRLNNCKENLLNIVSVEKRRQVTIVIGLFCDKEADRVAAWARSRLFDESGELRLSLEKDDVG